MVLEVPKPVKVADKITSLFELSAVGSLVGILYALGFLSAPLVAVAVLGAVFIASLVMIFASVKCSDRIIERVANEGITTNEERTAAEERTTYGARRRPYAILINESSGRELSSVV